ncbi:MAG: PIN domain-containing protein [Candidatus Thermoplasmatota archaeon]|nr:PIN domain-containing protein [Candidatus Thermoplasmatota archaeon]
MDPLKEYVLDTMALVRLLDDSLPKKANAVIKGAEKGDNLLLVPEVVLGEFLYIALKGRLETEDPVATTEEVLMHLRSSRYVSPVQMDFSCWEAFLEVGLAELHDRIICSIASARNVPLVTDDKEITAWGGVEIIWN